MGPWGWAVGRLGVWEGVRCGEGLGGEQGVKLSLSFPAGIWALVAQHRPLGLEERGE